MDNNVEITEAELYAELDKILPKTSYKNFTDIQLKAITHARERNLSWPIIANWFNEKFNTSFKTTTLRDKYHREV
jgi:cysteinyl-tRNA synthetase